jgi:CRP/FNR family transcriptional regulator, anaerobic regulatory protein
MTDLPLRRLNQFITLTGPEAEAFARLATEERQLRRHDLIRAQGDPALEVFFLAEGWVASCVDSATGSRQIVKVHLPGDVMGTPSLALCRAAESLIALTAATVQVIPSDRVGGLFATAPKVAAAMFLSAQQERIWLMDRLMSVGRTSSVQRLAAFLLSLHERLTALGLASPERIELPLSQEEVGNVLGITGVHANRTFAQLDATGLVERSGRTVTLLDLAGLRCFSCVPRREFQRMPPWLSGIRETRPERAV